MFVKNSKIVHEMHPAISKLASRDYGTGHFKFKWGISRNQEKVNKAYEDIEKVKLPKPEYAEEWASYQREREEIIQLYASTDETGKFLVDEARNEYILQQDKRLEYRKASQPILDKYAEVIEKHNATLREYAECMDAETDIRIHKIKLDLIPDTVLSVELTALMPLWDDSEEGASNVVDLPQKSTKKKKKAN